jgi:DNA-directed RNA polymerase specialized sigma24 family protein
MANLASSGRSRQPFQEVVTGHGGAVLELCRALLEAAEAREAWTEVFLCALWAYPHLPDDVNVREWLLDRTRQHAAALIARSATSPHRIQARGA